MKNLAVNAYLNLKEQPQTLYVHGSVLTPCADDIVIVTKADSPGINPTILILDVKVYNENDHCPMKLTPKPFLYQSSEAIVTSYKQVILRFEDMEPKTFDIELFG